MKNPETEAAEPQARALGSCLSIQSFIAHFIDSNSIIT